MELSKNIFFNTDKLVENSKFKISYTGKLFQEASESVILHYGFGQNWNNVKDVEMEKTELGFQTEITLENGETCNLCFKNNNGVWDNNNGQNYIFPIEKISTSTLNPKSKSTIYSEILLPSIKAFCETRFTEER